MAKLIENEMKGIQLKEGQKVLDVEGNEYLIEKGDCLRESNNVGRKVELLKNDIYSLPRHFKDVVKKNNPSEYNYYLQTTMSPGDYPRDVNAENVISLIDEYLYEDTIDDHFLLTLNVWPIRKDVVTNAMGIQDEDARTMEKEIQKIVDHISVIDSAIM